MWLLEVVTGRSDICGGAHLRHVLHILFSHSGEKKWWSSTMVRSSSTTPMQLSNGTNQTCFFLFLRYGPVSLKIRLSSAFTIANQSGSSEMITIWQIVRLTFSQNVSCVNMVCLLPMKNNVRGMANTTHCGGAGANPSWHWGSPWDAFCCQRERKQVTLWAFTHY